MRLKQAFLTGLLLAAASQMQAAVRNEPVSYRQALWQDGQLTYQARTRPFQFQVEVVSDSQGVEAESAREGRPFVSAVKGDRFSVRLTNPLPVRVAVNLTVDGINSISGKPAGISEGDKWMIEPFGSITVPGWQVSQGQSRRFFFTDKPKSYAKWRGENLGRDLSANCGVIGAAFFWNQGELDRYYEDHPLVRRSPRAWNFLSKANRACEGATGAPACAEPLAPAKDTQEESGQQAGTGMGEAQDNPTYQVAFDFNRGMYSPDQALVIYYDFAKIQGPNPFPGPDYAPPMP
ncbi:MAG TPA: hypothetical protein VMU88_10775 [bacterium]|nr:hypothetical protein [bacterium]